MPTLINNGTDTHLIKQINGAMISVSPGGTVQTYDPAAVLLSGMAQTSAAPYYNPALARADITSSGPGDDQSQTLDAACASVEILNNSSSATITIFLNALANTPGLKVVPNSQRKIDGLRGNTGVIVMQSDAAVVAGECYLTQLR